MSREKEGFRDNLERLNTFFPEIELLTRQDLVRFTGRDWRVVCRLFGFAKNDKYISKADAARIMSKGA